MRRLYVDLKILFGYAMMQYLPLKDFKTHKNVSKEFIDESRGNQKDETVGYILHVA